MKPGSQIVVNPDSDGNGSTIFIDCKPFTRFDNGASYSSIEIITPHGVARMTLHQWKTMLAIGLSMSMQEASNDETP